MNSGQLVWLDPQALDPLPPALAACHIRAMEHENLGFKMFPASAG
jgi:hypothetical protein